MKPQFPSITRTPRAVALSALLSLGLASCSGSDSVIVSADGGVYLASVSTGTTNGELISGSPPVPGSGPSLTIPASAGTITGGSTQIDVTGSASFRQVAVFVDGADGYYLLLLPTGVTTETIVVTLAGGPPALDFDVVFMAADANGVWGPRATTAMHAIRAAGGDVQVSVTWNTAADVDLHVIDPNGEEVYYGGTQSSSGGVLDIDANAACSTSDVTQENVGWAVDTAPSGQYIVRVDYWDNCGATQTDYVVTVSLRPGQVTRPGSPGASVDTYYGSFAGEGTGGGAGDGVTIATFGF